MPREDRIEAILAAWYELVNCAPSERANRREQRNALLDQAIAGTRSCRQELLEDLGQTIAWLGAAIHKHTGSRPPAEVCE